MTTRIRVAVGTSSVVASAGETSANDNVPVTNHASSSSAATLLVGTVRCFVTAVDSATVVTSTGGSVITDVVMPACGAALVSAVTSVGVPSSYSWSSVTDGPVEE